MPKHNSSKSCNLFIAKGLRFNRWQVSRARARGRIALAMVFDLSASVASIRLIMHCVHSSVYRARELQVDRGWRARGPIVLRPGSPVMPGAPPGSKGRPAARVRAPLLSQNFFPPRVSRFHLLPSLSIQFLSSDLFHSHAHRIHLQFHRKAWNICLTGAGQPRLTRAPSAASASQEWK